LSREWKSEKVMDAESGDDEKDGLTSEWDKTGEADGMNMYVYFKDAVMHI